MEVKEGKRLAHCASWTFVSKTFQPDMQQIKELLLIMMAVVGMIFLALSLLFLSQGHTTSHSFYVYMSIFLILESVFVSFRLYDCFRRKSRKFYSQDDEEKPFIVTGKNIEK